jgi:hypothetical protein
LDIQIVPNSGGKITRIHPIFIVIYQLLISSISRRAARAAPRIYIYAAVLIVGCQFGVRGSPRAANSAAIVTTSSDHPLVHNLFA